MSELLATDPVGYWTTGYILFTLLFLANFWKDYDCPPWKLPAVLWAASLLWPLTVALMLGLLVVLGAHALWKKVSNKK